MSDFNNQAPVSARERHAGVGQAVQGVIGKYNKKIQYYLLGTAVLLMLACLFYTLAVIDGAVLGTPEGEFDHLLQERMKKVLSIAPSASHEQASSIGSAEVKSGLNSVSETVLDLSQASNLNVTLQIVPNLEDVKQNIQYMRLAGHGGEAGEVSSDVPLKEYNQEAIGTGWGSKKTEPNHFSWRSNKHMHFPVVRLQPDYVPIGDSTSFCLGLAWAPTNKKNSQEYVKNLPECTGYRDDMNYWEVAPNDAFDSTKSPRTGLDFKLWDQIEVQDDKTCHGGIYKADANTCFTYRVLKSVCLLGKFRPLAGNVASWWSTTGCFAGGSAFHYETAKIGKEYDFSDVTFEVRVDQRAYSKDFKLFNDDEQRLSHKESAEDKEEALVLPDKLYVAPKPESQKVETTPQVSADQYEDEDPFAVDFSDADIKRIQKREPDCESDAESEACKAAVQKAMLKLELDAGRVAEAHSFYFYKLFRVLALLCLLGALVCLGFLLYEMWAYCAEAPGYQEFQNQDGQRPTSRHLSRQDFAFGANSGSRAAFSRAGEGAGAGAGSGSGRQASLSRRQGKYNDSALI